MTLYTYILPVFCVYAACLFRTEIVSSAIDTMKFGYKNTAHGVI